MNGSAKLGLEVSLEPVIGQNIGLRCSTTMTREKAPKPGQQRGNRGNRPENEYPARTAGLAATGTGTTRHRADPGKPEQRPQERPRHLSHDSHSRVGLGASP